MAADPFTMQSDGRNAEARLLNALQDAATLTSADPWMTARERLCGLIGYRLYRSLVAGLAGL